MPASVCVICSLHILLGSPPYTVDMETLWAKSVMLGILHFSLSMAGFIISSVRRYDVSSCYPARKAPAAALDPGSCVVRSPSVEFPPVLRDGGMDCCQVFTASELKDASSAALQFGDLEERGMREKNRG